MRPFGVDPRLELIDSLLVVGGSLEGSRCLAATLLADHGPPLALPFAPVSVWHEALLAVYPDFPAHAPPASLDAWARAVPHQRPPRSEFARGRSRHDQAVNDALRYGLYQRARAGCGRALGPDFVMRLAEDGLTPDLLFIGPAHVQRLHSYYLDGPADLVAEVTHSRRRDADMVERRRRYDLGGVPEYWVVEPATQTIYCWRRAPHGAGFALTKVTQGTLTATSVSGLRLDVSALWTSTWGRPADPFLEARSPAHPPEENALSEHDSSNDSLELGWDSLAFPGTAGAALDQAPIQFEQYLAWCPESKFERMDGRLSIAGSEGTRRVMLLLMMTLGLRNIVPLLPLRAWVVFLHYKHYLPAIRADLDRLLARARTQKTNVGETALWFGSVAGIPIHVVADTQAACRSALDRALCNHLLYALATDHL